MNYLLIDAALRETENQGKVQWRLSSAEELGLISDTADLLQDWLLKYEAEYFSSYTRETTIAN